MTDNAPRRRTPLQQAQEAAPRAGTALRRAMRAPVAPAAAARTNAVRNTQVSTHQGRSTVAENARSEQVATVDVDPDTPTHVKVSLGKTINLGNYESLRVDVEVLYPCTVGTIQEAIEIAHEHVIAGLEREQSYMLGSAPAPRRANRRG